MELGIAYVICGLIHGYILAAVHCEPFSKRSELDIDFSLFIVMRSCEALGIILLHEHPENIHELRKDRYLFYRSGVEEVQIIDLHESLKDEIIDIRMCLRSNEKRFGYQFLELFVIEESLKEINVEQIDESDT